MVDVSEPERIVDALAYVGLLIPGVKAAYGCGASGIVFPTTTHSNPGGKMQPIPENGRVEPFTWTAQLPDAPMIQDYSATNATLDWQIPCRLYLDKAGIQQLQRDAGPFYGRILTAIHQHASLGGTCGSARVVRFGIGGDEDKAWLSVIVSAWERLNLETQPGEQWV